MGDDFDWDALFSADGGDPLLSWDLTPDFFGAGSEFSSASNIDDVTIDTGADDPYGPNSGRGQDTLDKIGPDPYGPDSGRGEDTLSRMGLKDDTNPDTTLDKMTKAGKGVLDFIERNKLAPALLKMGGGVIDRYQQNKQQQENEEAARERKRAGFASGTKYSLWRSAAAQQG